MEEKLELMNETVELVGDTELLEEVIEATAKKPGTVVKVIKKYGIPVVVITVVGLGAYYGFKKFKQAKEAKIVYEQDAEVEVVEKEEE